VKPKFEKAPDNVLPRCPHCDRRLEKIWLLTQGMGFWQQRQVLVCPYCEACLGYGSVRFFG
jgi:hypothetical protein